MGDLVFKDKYILKLKSGENVDLHYRTRTYKQSQTQDIAQVRRLQRSGVDCKLLNGVYYILSELMLVPLEERRTIIDNILTKEELGEDGIELLGSYYIGGYEDGMILNSKNLRRIRKYEFGTEPVFKKKGYKAKDTACNRLFKLYSYEPRQQSEEFYWWSGEHVKPIGKEHRRKGLINSCQPYMAQWILLSAANDFKFGDKYYTVTAPQYLEGKADMVLCLSQNGHTYFFDEEVCRLAEEFVHERHNV